MKPIPVKYRHVNLDNCLMYTNYGVVTLGGKPFDIISVISNVKKPSKYGVVTFCYKLTRVNQIPGLYNLDMNFHFVIQRMSSIKSLAVNLVHQHSENFDSVIKYISRMMNILTVSLRLIL